MFKYNPIKYILFLLFFSLGTIQSQETSFVLIKNSTPKLYKKYKKAKQLAYQKKLDKAYKLFNEISRKCPTCVEPYQQMGTIHYQRGEFEAAASKFSHVFSLQKNFNPKLYYTMGLAYWKIGQYTEAAVAFQDYIDQGKTSSPLMKKAKRKLSQSLFALKPKNEKIDDPQLITAEINTDQNESFPITTANAQTLIYTARINRRDYLFQSKRQNSRWNTPIQLDIDSNQYESGAHTISPDGKVIIFTSCSKNLGYGSCDLYISKQVNGRWSTPRNMGSRINSSSWDGHPSLGNNGQALYFSSKRKGGFGQKDIWASYKNKNGIWSKPINLGKVINTPNNEQAPFIHPDNSTLYFGSDGHPGMGDMDLFLSRKKSDLWTSPINLGQPINTRVQEGCMSISLDGTEGFLVSDRKYEAQLLKDNHQGAEINIYRFDVHPEIAPLPVTYVEATIIDINGNAIPLVDISLFELSEMTSFYDGRTDMNGQILLVLPANKMYAFNAQTEGFLFHSENFSPTANREKLDPYKITLTLHKIPIKKETIVTAPIVLKNVFFETGKYELKKESFHELDQLYALLLENQNLNIQINGHTDNVGDPKDNSLLSEQRANAVYDYLVKKGVSSSRLKYRGYGEDQPIDSNETEEGRRINRRTEFKVHYSHQ